MKKLFLIAGVIAISGCATIQNGANTAGDYLCANKDSLRMSYVVMLNNALVIENAIVRQSMIGAAQAGLAALDTCPTSEIAPYAVK